MSRAQEFRAWCGQDEPWEFTVARFYDRHTAEPVQQTVAAPPGCQIYGYCRVQGRYHIERPGVDESQCTERLRELSNQCGNWTSDGYLRAAFSTGNSVHIYWDVTYNVPSSSGGVWGVDDPVLIEVYP